jgi:hypothetical protein
MDMNTLIRRAAGREVPPQQRRPEGVDGVDGGVRAPHGHLASDNERMNVLIRAVAGRGPQVIGRAENGLALQT